MKYYLTLVFLLLTIFSKSQNYVDFSKRNIISSLHESYYISYTNSGIQYLYTNDDINQTTKYYYFDNNRICYLYIVVYKNATYSYIENILDKKYYRYGNRWTTPNSYVTIKSGVNGYRVFFRRR